MTATAHGPSKFGFRVAMLEEAKELFAGFLGEGFIRLIPADWVVKAAENLPESLLTDNDTRLRWAAGIGLVLDGLIGLGAAQRNAIQNFLVQTAEEVGKRSSELDLYGSTKDRKVIREAMDKNKGELEPLRAKKGADDKKQASAAVEHHSVLHIVGTLAKDDALTFWAIVAEAQKLLNEEQRATKPNGELDPGEVPAGDEVMRLVSRVSLTREQISAIIKAPSEQRRDALIDALRQATSAGGVGEPFARLLDRVARLVETTLPTGGSAGKLRKSMADKVTELKKDNKKFFGLR